MAIRVDGIDWVPFGAILHVPALQSAGRAGATPAVEVRLERFAMLRFCPVEALEVHSWAGQPDGREGVGSCW